MSLPTQIILGFCESRSEDCPWNKSWGREEPQQPRRGPGAQAWAHMELMGREHVRRSWGAGQGNSGVLMDPVSLFSAGQALEGAAQGAGGGTIPGVFQRVSGFTMVM